VPFRDRDPTAKRPMTSDPEPSPEEPVILVVGPENELSYLLARYAGQGRRPMRIQRTDSLPATFPARAVDVIWFQTLHDLVESRPRERGLEAEETLIIVSASPADDTRAVELGADHCAQHPLTYAAFRAALASVGLVEDEGR
jgi:hypothetical protein